MTRDERFCRRPSGPPLYHDFLGTHERVIKRPLLSEKEIAFFKAEGRWKRWSDAISALTLSWNEIPRAETVKRGDLILYRRENIIPNIHCSFYPNIPLVNVMAYPDRINSITKEGGGIGSISVIESRWTSFRDPNEALRAFTDEAGNGDKAIRQLRDVGYLKDEQMVIPAADFRLFNDINKFLTEKFGLSLPSLPQKHEPFHPT